ncbi:ras-related protein Rab-19-like isoform X1 [Danio aesculapii]|uniref:ras-related protein Rab-19-like isoform X1 n=1 Tax=Danio aesculapii TaxID=1142201 RepID=UPI0024BF6C39|nr:ras-related protein Rab-19-like isoform X1 [Danio aesculapii]
MSDVMEPPDDSFDFLFKIILIGDSNVGKTSLVQSFSTGLFSQRQHNTIGVDFTVRTLNLDGRRVKMQVWDTAGQERFRTITQSYYRSAHGALIAYDISRRATFDSVQRWLHELHQYGAANVLVALIGNKRDLEPQREVPFSDACRLAEDKGMLAALETSAREACSVQEAFQMMARQLLLQNGLSACQEEETHGPGVLLRSNSRSINISSTHTEQRHSCQC